MKKYIGIILAILVFSVQLSLVHAAGMSWDEPASFFIGRMNLQFWQTGDWTNLIDYTNTKRFPGPMYYVSGEEWYPPFPFLVASATSTIFSDRLHLLSIVDAHHMGELILGAIGVAAFWGIATEIGLSTLVASGTTLIFALYPTIWGQMRSDAKDIPLMSMLTLSIYLFLRWLRAWQKSPTSKSWGWGFLWAVTLGLAECTKPSAALIVPILIIWFIVSLLISRDMRKRIRNLPFFLFSTVVFGILAVCIFFLSWPWLWDNPVGKLTTVLGFFRTVGYFMPVEYVGHLYRAGFNLPKTYPFGVLVFQTPIEITILALVGSIAGLWAVIKHRKIMYLLLLLWFWIGISRFLLPQFIIYAKVRHFIDAMPAFFLLMGVGIEEIVKLIYPLRFGRQQDNNLRFGRCAIYAHLSKFYLSILNHLSSVRVLGKLYTSPRKEESLAPRRDNHGGLLLLVIVMFFIFLHEVIISIQFYPYEPSYYNFLVGGSKNVAANHLFDDEYWGTGTKEAMDYINSLGTAPVSVYSCLMRHLTIYYANKNVILLPDHPEYAEYNLVPNSVSWFKDAMYFGKTYETTAYVIKRAGADLFYVFKNTSRMGFRCGNETMTSYGYDTE